MEATLFYKQLLSFVMKRVNNTQDAEDIVQDVFLKAQLKSHQLKESGKLTAWMFTMTRNSIMDFYRQKKKMIDAALVHEIEDYNDFNDCISGCIDELIVTLPEPYKEALALADLENLPQKELADKLGISYSGAKSRVQRARQMLKEKLETVYAVKTDGYGNVTACKNQDSCTC